MKKNIIFTVFILFALQLQAITVDTSLNGSYYMYVINASNGYTGIADHLNYKPYVELQKILVYFESDSLVFYKDWEHLWKISNVGSTYYENFPGSNIFMLSLLGYNKVLDAYIKESTCIIDLKNPLKPYVFSIKEEGGFSSERNVQIENNIPVLYLNWVPYSRKKEKRKYYYLNVNSRQRREISSEDYIPKSSESKFTLQKDGQFRSDKSNYIFLTHCRIQC